MKIKISEVFYSLQGEGIQIGIPTVFVRLFGCDLSVLGVIQCMQLKEGF